MRSHFAPTTKDVELRQPLGSEWSSAVEGYGAERGKASASQVGVSKVASMISRFERPAGNGSAKRSQTMIVRPKVGSVPVRRQEAREHRETSSWLRVSSATLRKTDREKNEEAKTRELAKQAMQKIELMEQERASDGNLSFGSPFSSTSSSSASPCVMDRTGLDSSPVREHNALTSAVQKDCKKKLQLHRNLKLAYQKLTAMEPPSGICANGDERCATRAAVQTCQEAALTTIRDSEEAFPVDNDDDDGNEAGNLSSSFTKKDFTFLKQDDSAGQKTQPSRISSPQPEEEAEDSRRVSESGASCSRLSLPSSEPAGEPQPQDTPKEPPKLFGFNGKYLDEDNADISETSSPCSGTATPVLESGQEADTEPEAACSLNSISSSEGAESAEGELDVDQGSFDDCPKAGEEGMPRRLTLLHAIEQNELMTTVNIIVPEGLTSSSRLVTFMWDSQAVQVNVPEQYNVGDTVPIRVSRAPPLEKSPQHAWIRGHHPENNFPQAMDRNAILEFLKHGGRAREGCTLKDQEFQNRMHYYKMLRGVRPLVPTVDENQELQWGQLE